MVRNKYRKVDKKIRSEYFYKPQGAALSIYLLGLKMFHGASVKNDLAGTLAPISIGTTPLEIPPNSITLLAQVFPLHDFH